MVKEIKRWWPLFVLPTALSFLFGFVIPFAQGLYLSFCEFITVGNAKFVGLRNYVDALADTQRADASAHTTPETAAVPAATAGEILPRYRALYEKNPDLIGWLRIDGTGIDLPVVQTPGDNEYYLRRVHIDIYDDRLAFTPWAARCFWMSAARSAPTHRRPTG